MAGYAGACHRTALCADPVGSNPPSKTELEGQTIWMEKGAIFFERRLAAYCCGHVFRRERPINLVGRPDGADWQFTCGGTDHSDSNEPYHVSIGVLLDFDQTLHEIADLPAYWEAEREAVGDPWIRTEGHKPKM
jgi:hypothetical protein